MRDSAELTQAERRNREIVLELYDKSILNWNFEAGRHLLGETYTQHDPIVADGQEGLRQFIESFSAQNPHIKTHIKHVYVDGDTVLLHVHSEHYPGHRGVAIVEIYRLENEKIVEHWDVIQQIPEQAAHGNGMF